MAGCSEVTAQVGLLAVFVVGVESRHERSRRADGSFRRSGMSEDRKKPSPVVQCCVAAAIAALMLALYVGAYALTVTPERVFQENPLDRDELIPIDGVYAPIYLEDQTMASGELLQAVFSPVHGIDRWLRPSVWGQRP
jgi:hypothetical protein